MLNFFGGLCAGIGVWALSQNEFVKAPFWFALALFYVVCAWGLNRTSDPIAPSERP